MKKNKNLMVALDMGTSKIAVLIAEYSADKTIDIIGFGTSPSHGLKRGVVVNIEDTVQSIQHAVEAAELMAGCQIHSAFTGIAGGHIQSFNSHGIVAIRSHEVTQQDVDRVMDAAKAVAIPADQQILHLLPQEFIIDQQGGVKDPIGMSGVRLEAMVHIVTGSVSAMQNISKCVRRCGIQINDMVLEPLASSHSILTDDEKELGICLIDIGGGTTDMAVFTEGAIRHTAILPIAGDHVTNDIAIALRIPAQSAEHIKIEAGAVLNCDGELGTMLDISPALQTASQRPARPIDSKVLVDIITARYEELFRMIYAELRRSGFADAIAGGLVLTGGASKMKNLVLLAEHVFQMPVRLGTPFAGVQTVVGITDNPSYATAVGLLMHVSQKPFTAKRSARCFDLTAHSVWSRVCAWFHGNF